MNPGDCTINYNGEAQIPDFSKKVGDLTSRVGIIGSLVEAYYQGIINPICKCLN